MLPTNDQLLLARRPLVIELGCGSKKVYDNSIGVDLLPSPFVDVVADACDFIKELDDSCVDTIHSSHFLEHVEDPTSLLASISRVLRTGGCAIFIVPHFSNPFFYSDPTHKRAFGLYSFCYYCSGDIFRRNVPSYSRIPGIEIKDVRLVFRSTRVHPILHLVSKAFGFLVNSSRWLQELYEEFFPWIFPCYEIKYTIARSESEVNEVQFD